MTNHASVNGTSRIEQEAVIKDHAFITGNVTVNGKAHIKEQAILNGAVFVTNNARVSGGTQLSGNVTVYDNARVSGCVILKGNEAIRNHAIVVKASDIFHTTINDQSITYTKNNDNWHTITFDGSTEEFLESAKTAEQKRLYKLLIALAKKGTSSC